MNYSEAEKRIIKRNYKATVESLGWDLQNISMRGIQSHIEDWW